MEFSSSGFRRREASSLLLLLFLAIVVWSSRTCSTSLMLPRSGVSGQKRKSNKFTKLPSKLRNRDAFFEQKQKSSRVSTSQKGPSRTDPLECSRLVTTEALGWEEYNHTKTIDGKALRRSAHKNETTYLFRVPMKAVEACGLGSPLDDDMQIIENNHIQNENDSLEEEKYFGIYPLQSSPQDIADSMAGKHIILLGDSSLRMLYEYLVGRTVGDYTHWPANVSNHGPQEHSNNCGGTKEDSSYCAYHFYWNTGLISFYWANGHSSDAFEKYRHELVGSPNLVIATFGYWNKDDIEGGGHHGDEMISSEFIEAIESAVNHQEMNETYPNAYDTEYKTKKIFMTTFSDEIVSSQNATKIAKSYGWGIFDRTRIRKPGMPLDTPLRRQDHVKAHPMDVVLEIELELLLAVIRATPQERVVSQGNQ